MLKKDFEVQILVNGNPVKEYIKDGKNYIEGKQDSAYSIRIKNNSSRRIVAVPTVDGLSVIDGNTGSYNSVGYVIGGYGSIVIDGWRKNENEIATFYFSTPEKSYSKMIEKGDNVGVVGVAIFYEKYKEYDPIFTTFIDNLGINKTFFTPNDNSIYNWESSGDFRDDIYSPRSTCYCCNSSNPVNQKIGTGWGETKRNEIKEIPFERDQSSLTEFIFYYNTRQELEKIGIDFKKEAMHIEHPRAFPGEAKPNKYCQEPN